MKHKYLSLQDIGAYRIAFELANEVWCVVIRWEWFAKDTIGKQLMRSADSISANLAEGFGRYHKWDKIQFYRYSFGSLRECEDWIEKARQRKLVTQEEFTSINQKIQLLPREINALIKFTKDKLTV